MKNNTKLSISHVAEPMGEINTRGTVGEYLDSLEQAGLPYPADAPVGSILWHCIRERQQEATRSEQIVISKRSLKTLLDERDALRAVLRRGGYTLSPDSNEQVYVVWLSADEARRLLNKEASDGA